MVAYGSLSKPKTRITDGRNEQGISQKLFLEMLSPQGSIKAGDVKGRVQKLFNTAFQGPVRKTAPGDWMEGDSRFIKVGQ